MSPMKQFTTLDTHDGIGIVDVKDLMSDEEIEEKKKQCLQKVLMQRRYIIQQLMAGSLLAIWLMLLIFIVFQKKFIEGIATSGGKL